MSWRRWIKILTESQKKTLVQDVIDNVTFDLTVSYDITSTVKHFRASSYTIRKPPCVTYTFLPVQGSYFRSTTLKIDDITSKYPHYGFAQPEFVEIRTMALEDPVAGITGREIAYLMLEKVRAYMFYAWPGLLTGFGAFIKFSTMNTVDESSFIQGSNLFSYVMRFVMVTTTTWQFTPPGGAEGELVDEIVADVDDEASENSIQIKVEV